MNRYENGKIYKITDVGYNKYYIGSTCESLSKRMTRHREHYQRYIKGTNPKKISVFELFCEFGIENCKIELIENFPCVSREELFRREGHHIKTSTCVNKVVSGRSKQEWIEDNPEKFKEQREKDKVSALEYYYKNKDEILQYRLEKIECPLCQRLISRHYLPIHIQTKKAHPEEAQ